LKLGRGLHSSSYKLESGIEIVFVFLRGEFFRSIFSISTSHYPALVAPAPAALEKYTIYNIHAVRAMQCQKLLPPSASGFLGKDIKLPYQQLKKRKHKYGGAGNNRPFISPICMRTYGRESVSI